MKIKGHLQDSKLNEDLFVPFFGAPLPLKGNKLMIYLINKPKGAIEKRNYF